MTQDNRQSLGWPKIAGIAGIAALIGFGAARGLTPAKVAPPPKAESATVHAAPAEVKIPEAYLTAANIAVGPVATGGVSTEILAPRHGGFRTRQRGDHRCPWVWHHPARQPPAGATRYGQATCWRWWTAQTPPRWRPSAAWRWPRRSWRARPTPGEASLYQGSPRFQCNK